MLENLIWTCFFGIPFAVGLFAMGLTPPEFNLARGCFIFSALVILVRIIWWLSFEQHISNKFIFIFSIAIAFLVIGLLLGSGLCWINIRDITATQIKDRNTGETVSAPPTKSQAYPNILPPPQSTKQPATLTDKTTGQSTETVKENASSLRENHFPFIDVEIEEVNQYSRDIYIHNKSNVAFSKVIIFRTINSEKNKQINALRGNGSRLRPFQENISVLAAGERKKIHRDHINSPEYVTFIVFYQDDIDKKYKCTFEGNRNRMRLIKKEFVD